MSDSNICLFSLDSASLLKTFELVEANLRVIMKSSFGARGLCLWCCDFEFVSSI